MSDSPHRFPDDVLHAWVDGRLDPARAAEVEAAMRDDPTLAETLHAWRAQRDGLARLGRETLDEPVPEAMRTRLDAAVAQAEREARVARGASSNGPWRIAAAAAIVAAAGLGFLAGRGTAPSDGSAARPGSGGTGAPMTLTDAGGSGGTGAPTGSGGAGSQTTGVGSGGTGTPIADAGTGGTGMPVASTGAGGTGAPVANTAAGGTGTPVANTAAAGTGAPATNTAAGGTGAPLADGAVRPLPTVDPSAPPPFVRAAAVAHGVYVPEVRHPVEVSGDERGHLVAWLSKRLGSTLAAPDLTGEGFELVGGRLLPGERGPSAQLMYQDSQGVRITLYVARGEGANDATAFRFERAGAVQSFYWIDRGLGYVLSGELPREQLSQLATAVYRALETAPR